MSGRPKSSPKAPPTPAQETAIRVSDEIWRELNAAWWRGAFSGLEILEREFPNHPRVKFMRELLDALTRADNGYSVKLEGDSE